MLWKGALSVLYCTFYEKKVSKTGMYSMHNVHIFLKNFINIILIPYNWFFGLPCIKV